MILQTLPIPRIHWGNIPIDGALEIWQMHLHEKLSPTGIYSYRNNSNGQSNWHVPFRKERTEYRQETIENILDLADQKKVEAIAEGKSVVDGVGQYIVTVRGSFLGENAQFDATKHSLGVSYTPGQLLRDQLKAVKVICNGLAQTGPVINSITDSVTKSISQVITSGGPAVISGSNIKILGDDPSVGIYLTKDEEGAVPLKVSVIVHNAPSQLTIMLPAIEAGKLYALSITTQYSGSNKALKTPRSYRFPILLGDENAGGGGGGGEAPDPEIPGGGEAPDPAA